MKALEEYLDFVLFRDFKGQLSVQMIPGSIWWSFREFYACT